MAAVSTPGTPTYGKYLTSTRFRARFAPNASDVAAVRKFATDSGLSVTTVPENHAYVALQGTVAQVEKAFGTTLKNYLIDGRQVRAASTATSIPAALAGIVTAVSGVASISSLMSPRRVDGPSVKARSAKATTTAIPSPGSSRSAPPPDAFVNAQPCSDYYGQKLATSVPTAYGQVQPYAPCGYTPAQLQSAYGISGAVKAGLDGRGVTVAIIDA